MKPVAPLALLLCLAATAILVAPASAQTIHVHKQIPQVVGGLSAGSPLVTKREIVRVKHLPPPDSDSDGCPDSKDSYNGPGCEPPPIATSVTGDVASAAAPTSVTTSSGGYSIPSYIVACESGGNYQAQNPSGAYGAYQIMPGTASAYGCDLSTAAGQDSCAAAIYADVGTSAWVCG